MRILKSLVFFLIINLLFSFCLGNDSKGKEQSTKTVSLEKSYSVENFLKLSRKKMADLVNSLDEKSKTIFLKNVIIKSTWQSDYDIFRFLSNGEIISVDESYKYKKNEFEIAYWKIKKNKLILWKKNKNVAVPGYMREEWELVSAEYSSNGKMLAGSLNILFKAYNIDEKKNFEVWLVYLGKYKPKHMEEYEKKIKKK